ncbi:LacI family DNA-binding transcriptional regulator [Jatrophihabitans fulvus]
MTTDRPPSLRTVAERAGVSVRTVSNVVNDYVHVAPATREAVQRAIDEVGYRPNVAARQLRGGRTGLLGLVLPELHSPYFAELAALIARQAADRGWTVLADETAGDADRERALLGRTATNVVDGLVVSPWALSPDEIAAAAGGLPVVVLGERSAATVDRVAIDNVAAARDATRHLIERGRTTLAAIGLQPHLSNETAAQRVRGFRSALRTAKLPRSTHREIATQTLHRADGAAAVASLLDRDATVDGLVCFTDELALGAIRELTDRGVRVPDDIAVVGIDDIEDGRYSVPRLTTVAPDKDAIAGTAVRTLIDRIEQGSRIQPSDVVVPHRLIVRESS